jgi:hypothetical protein
MTTTDKGLLPSQGKPPYFHFSSPARWLVSPPTQAAVRGTDPALVTTYGRVKLRVLASPVRPGGAIARLRLSPEATKDDRPGAGEPSAGPCPPLCQAPGLGDAH